MASKKKMVKKVAKTVKKMAKKNPKGLIALIIVALVIGALAIGGYMIYKEMFPSSSLTLNGEKVTTIGLNDTYVEKGATATYKGKDVSEKIEIKMATDKEMNNVVTTIDTSTESDYYINYSINYEKMNKTIQRIVYVRECTEMSISFLELGNEFTGDCTYIKAGDVDILIDAGSRKNSAPTICSYLNQSGRVDDGKIEYLVVTHAHQDHIAGLVGSSGQGIFDQYEIGTVIEFAQTGKSDTGILGEYYDKRDAEKQNGANVYTALDCVKETNGAKKKYDLAPGITMEILDQKYYHEVSADENDHSVVALFTQGSNHYLFTGDLEKNGEASLVEKNPSLPTVQLFKGGHHGSYTANTDTLLSNIQPEVVCCCCCCGSTEYTSNVENTFPSQVAINNYAKYTDKVYVTTIVSSNAKGYESMNGNITLYCQKGTTYEVHGSNNDTKLKDTQWFKNNRTCPSQWQ